MLVKGTSCQIFSRMILVYFSKKIPHARYSTCNILLSIFKKNLFHQASHRLCQHPSQLGSLLLDGCIVGMEYLHSSKNTHFFWSRITVHVLELLGCIRCAHVMAQVSVKLFQPRWTTPGTRLFQKIINYELKLNKNWGGECFARMVEIRKII